MAGFFFPEQVATPESIASRRLLLNAMQKENLSAAPVGHWTQALARVLGSAADGYEGAKLSASEKKMTDENRAAFMAAFGLGSGGPSPLAASSAGAGGPASPSAPATVSRGTAETAAPAANSGDIGGRLAADLQRDFGLKPEQAAGVVGNLAHESGNFRTLQEIKPMVPGSRGGFGYAQWTGPRRIAFEQYAHQNGLDPTSYEANYGFLKHELQNTGEGRVLGALRSAGDVNTATQVFSNQFLRPGIPAMDSRLRLANQYAGGAGGAATNNQPGISVAPVQQSPNVLALMQALSSPWASKNPALAQVATAMITQQMGKNPVQEQLLRLQLQSAQRDADMPKTITIKRNGEDVTQVWNPATRSFEDPPGSGPAGNQQTYRMPDGREIPLPTNPEARKSMLSDLGKESAKSVADAPNVMSKMSQGIKTINELIGSPDGKVKEHPGFKQMFGMGRYLPAAPGGSWFDSGRADAEAIVEQLKSQAFLTAVKEMTGMGALSNAEGAKIESAVSRLSTKQSPEAFKAGLRDVQADLERGFRKAQIIAGNGRAPAPTPTAAPSASQDGWKIERVN